MNVQIVCRTCLKENAEMKPIFCTEEPENLSEMIAACTLTTVCVLLIFRSPNFLQELCLFLHEKRFEIKFDFLVNSFSFFVLGITTKQVSELDGLPSQMCLQCIENIKISYGFKQQCEKAYETLKCILGIHIETEGITAQSTEQATPEKQPDVPEEKPDSSDSSSSEDEFSPKSSIKAKKVNDVNIKELGPNEKCIQTEEICFYPCEMCEMKFLNEDALRVNRLTLSFGNGFNFNLFFQIHRGAHKETGYKCRVCSKTYSRLTHLRRHISAHHPDIILSKALDEIICTVCNKQFTRMEHLRRHIATHGHHKIPKVERDVDADEENNKSGLSDVEMPYNDEKKVDHSKLKAERDDDDER